MFSCSCTTLCSLILTLLLTSSSASLQQPVDHVTVGFSAPFNWKPLTRFWSTAPRPGDAMELTGEGSWLIRASAALYEQVCPWWKPPAEWSDPFTNYISTVRLLSATRNATGDIVSGPGCTQMHWDLLKTRLNFTSLKLHPFVVWDNVPFCFVDHPVLGTYGQIAPPSNETQWGEFVHKVTKFFKDNYGQHNPSSWRHRVATEPNNKHGHWSGTQQQFLQHYDWTTHNVKRVFPNAKVGPGNVCTGCPPDNGVSWTQWMDIFVDHIVNGTNNATGKTGSPLDWLSLSVYANGVRHGMMGYDPQVGADMATVLRNMRNKLPPLMRGNVTLEFQEFGTLANEKHRVSGEPGAFGAAWTLAMYIRAGMEGGVSNMFHWGNTDRLDSRKGYYFLQGNAWVMANLELVLSQLNQPMVTVGHTHYTMGPRAGLNVTAAYMQEKGNQLSTTGDRFLLLSAFNVYRHKFRTQRITVNLPAGAPPVKHATKRCLTLENSVYDVILADLEDSHPSYLRYKDGLPYGLSRMLTEEGHIWLFQHETKYWDLFAKSLEETGLEWNGSIVMDTPSVCVLRLS